MNRIILIGNGFDLAHGLLTSYTHFLDDYWRRKSDKIAKEPSSHYEDADIRIDMSKGKPWTQCWNPSSKPINSYYDFKENMYKVQEVCGNPWSFFQYNNKFLEKITGKSSLTNWVDIEEEYYTELKNCINGENNIDNLNQDFELIKNELRDYLRKINGKLKDYTIDFPIGEIMEKIYSNSKQIDTILFLNFNYTATHKFYTGEYDVAGYNNVDTIKTESIRIHGSLREAENNPIIFGYGNEQDDAHKQIENLGGNYLDNIKNINYLKTSNQKKMRDFIDSKVYEVFIMGHSCGMSDKTLLRTLFEHNNCLSIKPFYYVDKHEHNNYDDLVKNIYRIFTDKSLMNKVVAKDCCGSLLQSGNLS
jgi:hypothetical protein